MGDYIFIPPSDAYRVFMFCFSIATSLGGFIQLFRVIARLDAVEEVNLMPWSLTLASNLGWIVYGMMQGDWHLLTTSGIAGGGSFVVVAMLCVHHTRRMLYKTTSGASRKKMDGNVVVDCVVCGSEVHLSRIQARGVQVFVFNE